jgi:hypothetical protein
MSKLAAAGNYSRTDRIVDFVILLRDVVILTKLE